jgi:uncharacterized membrane protein
MKTVGWKFNNRFYDSKSELDKTIIVSCLFSIMLVLFRIAYTGRYLFISMIWNLFLAFIPYALSNWISNKINRNSKLSFIISTLIWLLFIPNSFYIITDLFHLNKNGPSPVWYDLALLFSFAWNGLLFGIISVRQMERMFEQFFNKRFDLLFVYPVMALNAFGIYLGRYLRFNSWDVVSNPVLLLRDVYYLIVHPLRNRVDWGMIICYSVLMTLIYVSLKKLGRTL